MKPKTETIHLETDVEIVELADRHTARIEKAKETIRMYCELAHSLFENNKEMRKLIACSIRKQRQLLIEL